MVSDGGRSGNVPLSGNKPDFRSGWKETSHFNRKPMKFTGDPGSTDDFTGLSAVQVFKLFFCSAVWDLLVDETNRYAEQTISDHERQSTWTPTDVHEMRAFVALLIAMGINKSPQYTVCTGRHRKFYGCHCIHL